MALVDNFRNTIAVIVPPWLDGKFGKRLMYAFGTTVDALMDLYMEGVKARFPGEGTPDALPYIGNDRIIVRGFDEPDDSFVARLVRWLDSHRVNGTPGARLRQLRGYFTPHALRIRNVFVTAQAAHVAVWHSLLESVDIDGTLELIKTTPENWNWDGLFKGARFWTLLYVTGIFTDDGDHNDPGDHNDGGHVGSSATGAQIATVKKLISFWRGAHAHSYYTLIVFDDSLFDPTGSGANYPDGHWDLWSEGGGLPNRPAGVEFWEGPG